MNHRWPSLKALAAKGYFHEVDLLMSEKLGPKDDEPLACLISYLSLALRSGHLCVSIQNGQVVPPPQEFIEGEEIDLKPLEEWVVKGSESLAESQGHIPFTPIVKKGNYYYLQRYYVLEKKIENSLKALQSHDPRVRFKGLPEQLQSQTALLPEQKEAILKAERQSLTLISGGPGTGKTYTAGLMIRLMWEALSAEEKADFKIALAAPTGKAASNLLQSLKKAGGALPDMQAKTLHALLNVRENGQRIRDELLPYDLIVVDESSMIDVQMMKFLLASIKPSSRLVMLGDKHQLPPVEAGSLFADFMSCCREKSSELTRCMRAESKAIVELASAVNAGDVKEVFSSLSNDHVQRLYIEREPPTLYMDRNLASYIAEQFPNIKAEDCDPLTLIRSFNSFKSLSPLRKGEYGVDALNNKIMHEIAAKSKAELLACPIIVTSNDYRQGLFNGETGVLVRKGLRKDGWSHADEGDYALFLDASELGWKKIPALLLPKFEYAYCLSVHKSQGSEYDRVLFLMPPGTEKFGREIFYTAVTRARKQLEIWGSDETIQKTLKKTSRRQSGLMLKTN